MRLIRFIAAIALLAGLSTAAARDVGFVDVRVEFLVSDDDAKDTLGTELTRVRSEVAADLAATLGRRMRHLRFAKDAVAETDLKFTVTIGPEDVDVEPKMLNVYFRLEAHERTSETARACFEPFMTIDELVMEGLGEPSELEDRIRRSVGLDVDAAGAPTREALELQSILFENLFKHVILEEAAEHVEATRDLWIKKRRDEARIPPGSIFKVRISFADESVDVDTLTCRARLLDLADVVRAHQEPVMHRALVARAADDLNDTARELEHVQRLERSRAMATEVYLLRLEPEDVDTAFLPGGFDPDGVD